MINGHGDDIYPYAEIKSNFSSNVYNQFCHDGLYKHLAEHLDCIENYPEADARGFEMALTEHLALNSGEVLVTNGATEAIYLIAQAYKGSVSAILGPTFSEYADACRMFQHTTVLIDELSDIDGDQQIVWLCNPNNPTGKVLPLADLESVIKGYPEMIFVVDCSYAPFSCLPQLNSKQGVRFGNVIMLHSMTKRFAIPGLRLGFITGPITLLDQVRALCKPWSVNQLAISAGHYLLSHEADYVIDLVGLQTEVRYLTEALTELGFVRVFPTDCHFMLARTLVSTADSLKEYLATKCGILIRNASNFEGLDASYFRIAVQTHTENEELVKGILQWRNSL